MQEHTFPTSSAAVRRRAIALPRIRLSAAVASRVAATTVGLAVLTVYLTTLAPTVMWYDMGEFATAADTLGIAHNTGYPLLILLGKLFTFVPAGETAWRINLLSAVCTAAAVAVVFALIRDLTRGYVGAAIGAATLAFAPTVWANATWATSYGMNLLFTAIIARSMLAWHRDRASQSLVIAALALGLGLCNHRLIVLAAIPSAMLLVVGWRCLTPKMLALSAAAFLAGLSLYLYLPIRGEMEPALSWAQPAEWRTYWSMFLNGQTPSAYWSIDFVDRIDILWSYPSYDLTWPGLLLAAVGVAVLAASRHFAVAAFFAVIVALAAVVVETYAIHNVYNYLTPAYLALAVLIGVAVDWLARTLQRAAAEHAAVGAAMRPHVAVALVAGLCALLPAYLFVRTYDRVDRSGDYNAYDFARTTLDRMPPGAVILTDSWTAPPLWYLQLVHNYRRDVLVSPIYSVPGDDVAAFAQQRLDEGRSVYVAEGLRVNPGDLDDAFTIQPVLLASIERMVVETLPKPEYRDDLVMTGTLYKVLPEAPDTTAASVPAGAERDVVFPSGVTLAGIAPAGAIAHRGDVLQITYNWRADAPLTADLSAATIFAGPDGRIAATRGFPLWSQPRIIGQGVLATSRWVPGTIYRESYFSLVPRDLPPGTYTIKLAVFDPLSPSAETDAASLIPVAQISVR